MHFEEYLAQFCFSQKKQQQWFTHPISYSQWSAGYLSITQYLYLFQDPHTCYISSKAIV